MTIDLTDDQINQIFEGFDWYEYMRDNLDYDLVEEWLNNNPNSFIKFLDYGMDSGTKQDFEEWLQQNR